MLGAGVAGMVIALSLLRFLRRVRRMITTMAVLVACSGLGAGGGWAVLDALHTR